MAAEDLQLPRIGLDLQGPRVTLQRLAESADHFLGLLREVDQELTEQRGGSFEWVLSGLRLGSLELEAYAEPKTEEVDVFFSRQVFSAVRAGIKVISSQQRRPPHFTDAALTHARRLAESLSDEGVTEIAVRTNGQREIFSRSLVANVEALSRGTVKSIGSVEGRLETVSLHATPYFNVYSALTGRAVRCEFPIEDLERVREALGRRVSVFGVLLSSAETGHKQSLQVEEFTIFPPDEELPTAEDVRGILGNG